MKAVNARTSQRLRLLAQERVQVKLRRTPLWKTGPAQLLLSLPDRSRRVRGRSGFRAVVEKLAKQVQTVSSTQTRRCFFVPSLFHHLVQYDGLPVERDQLRERAANARYEIWSAGDRIPIDVEASQFRQLWHRKRHHTISLEIREITLQRSDYDRQAPWLPERGNQCWRSGFPVVRRTRYPWFGSVLTPNIGSRTDKRTFKISSSSAGIAGTASSYQQQFP